MSRSFTSTVAVRSPPSAASRAARCSRPAAACCVQPTAVVNEALVEEVWFNPTKKGYLKIHTTHGDLNVELDCDLAPRTCQNFLVRGCCQLLVTHSQSRPLARARVCRRRCRGCAGSTTTTASFSTAPSRRVQPASPLRLLRSACASRRVDAGRAQNFMLQGGDPTGTGTCGQSIWGRPFMDEPSKLTHSGRGVLSMANSGKHTNRSQFFILYKSAPHLDHKHTVFAKVVGGMETLTAMERVPTDSSDRPREEIRIIDVQIYVDPYGAPPAAPHARVVPQLTPPADGARACADEELQARRAAKEKAAAAEAAAAAADARGAVRRRRVTPRHLLCVPTTLVPPPSGATERNRQLVVEPGEQRGARGRRNGDGRGEVLEGRRRAGGSGSAAAEGGGRGGAAEQQAGEGAAGGVRRLFGVVMGVRTFALARSPRACVFTTYFARRSQRRGRSAVQGCNTLREKKREHPPSQASKPARRTGSFDGRTPTSHRLMANPAEGGSAHHHEDTLTALQEQVREPARHWRGGARSFTHISTLLLTPFTRGRGRLEAVAFGRACEHARTSLLRRRDAAACVSPSRDATRHRRRDDHPAPSWRCSPRSSTTTLAGWAHSRCALSRRAPVSPPAAGAPAAPVAPAPARTADASHDRRRRAQGAPDTFDMEQLGKTLVSARADVARLAERLGEPGSVEALEARIRELQVQNEVLGEQIRAEMEHAGARAPPMRPRSPCFARAGSGSGSTPEGAAVPARDAGAAGERAETELADLRALSAIVAGVALDPTGAGPHAATASAGGGGGGGAQKLAE